MSRLQTLAGKKALICYVVAGDPSMERTLEVIRALDSAGVDAIELGVPFSDPMADGPSIQAASFRALTDDSRAMSLLTHYQSRPQRIHTSAQKSLLDLRRAIADGHIAPLPESVSPEPPAPVEPEPPAPAPPAETTPEAKTTPSPTQPVSRVQTKKFQNEPTMWGRLVARLVACRPIVNRTLTAIEHSRANNAARRIGSHWVI